MPFVDGKWTWEQNEMVARAEFARQDAEKHLEEAQQKIAEEAEKKACQAPEPLSPAEIRQQNTSVSELLKSAFIASIIEGEEENKKLYAQQAKEAEQKRKEAEKAAKKDKKKGLGLFRKHDDEGRDR